MADNIKIEDYHEEDMKNNSRDGGRRRNDNRQDRRQMGHGPRQGNDNWPRKDVVKERLEFMSGPTTNLVSKEGVSVKKFTGRCRLFVGNLPTSITDDEFRKMFQQFGEIAEEYLNKQKGYGFVKLDTRQNAENAKAALDFTVKDGKSLRVRFATHGAALKVKNLSPWVSNELLEASFSVFGDVERAVVIVDDRGRPVGEGIVEYARKQSAQLAIKRCNEGCYLLTSSPRPVVVEPLEQRDEEDGLPEKNFQKGNKQYLKEREIGPRLTEPGTFEHEFANRWKKLYELEQKKREHLEKEIEEGRRQLDEQMEYAIYDHEANLLRERLRHMEEQSNMIQRERELRREEEIRREEARRQQEMLLRQQQEELLRNDMRRMQDESMMMQASGYGDMMDRRQSRFDQPPMGANYSSSNELNDMGGPPSGGGPGGRGGMRGAPIPPHEIMENMDEYGMDPKRRRY
ncbi:splicing factor, proline- and glutamine-rich-like isoform X2 [Uloborus diversus]|uniref:splicing factor, proline- and glutamine-rich-like isoform X2 n=1 Tax=Uloborus diversus TaxID=327109 RepID=UPI0024094406|nr:splicing factor, proline- and glutamine-rich-like isoform X2 [Uloborus diversus]